MLSANVTVTAHCGPDRLLTAGLFTGCTELNVDLPREILSFKSNGKHHEFDLHAVATITDGIVGGVHTVIVSE